MKTYVATPDTRERNWLVVDASGKTLGRLATQIADTLRGKRKPEYTPALDVGDFVIVVNAEKISVTATSAQREALLPAFRLSRRPAQPYARGDAGAPSRRRSSAWPSRGCCPRNRLGRAQLRKLKVYAGPDHPHAAQKPEPLEVEA